MHLGFATLEAGLTQHKNTVNILFKNVCIVSVGLLTYAVIGFNLMYPGEEYAGSFFGFSGFWLGTDAAGVTPAYNANYTYWAEWGIHLLGPHTTYCGRTSNSLPRADGTAPDRLVRRSEAGARTAVHAPVNAGD